MALPKVFQAHPVVEACHQTARESFENITKKVRQNLPTKGGDCRWGVLFKTTRVDDLFRNS